MKSKTNEIPEIPDINEWVPREKAMETLSESFLKRCQHIEQRIKLLSGQESQFNIDNYDSGLGVQQFIKKEFEKLLPNRYAVDSGVVNDRNGRTAGDCDILVYNKYWFPIIKSSESKRKHFPIESLYSIIEIKESLDYNTFDKAMKKLVICNRLLRPSTPSNRIIENMEVQEGCYHETTNPLYCAIIATKMKNGVTFENLINRFYDINKQLKRKEIVRSLCVFGQGTVTWGILGEGAKIDMALFMRDQDKEIVPLYHKYDEYQCAIYPLVINLLTHLYHSILAPEDMHIYYGSSNFSVRAPKSPDIRIDPDQEE